MMPALDGLTGIVICSIFGSVFVITCIISAIKAVRDRSHLKERIVAQEKENLENGYINVKKYCHIEDDSYTCQSSCSGNKRLSDGTTCLSGSVEHLDLSEYSIGTGVDNLTFQHSNKNIQYTDETQSVPSHKLITAVETLPSCQRLVPKRAKSHDAHSSRERHSEHYWTDILYIEKVLRRHSYEDAVCENSWLPQEEHCDSQSQTILDDFNSRKDVENSAKSFKVAFENKAYDKDDNRNAYVLSKTNVQNHSQGYKAEGRNNEGLNAMFLKIAG